MITGSGNQNRDEELLITNLCGSTDDFAKKE
jgi:hypothetical protein